MLVIERELNSTLITTHSFTTTAIEQDMKKRNYLHPSVSKGMKKKRRKREKRHLYTKLKWENEIGKEIKVVISSTHATNSLPCVSFSSSSSLLKKVFQREPFFHALFWDGFPFPSSLVFVFVNSFFWLYFNRGVFLLTQQRNLLITHLSLFLSWNETEFDESVDADDASLTQIIISCEKTILGSFLHLTFLYFYRLCVVFEVSSHYDMKWRRKLKTVKRTALKPNCILVRISLFHHSCLHV